MIPLCSQRQLQRNRVLLPQKRPKWRGWPNGCRTPWVFLSMLPHIKADSEEKRKQADCWGINGIPWKSGYGLLKESEVIMVFISNLLFFWYCGVVMPALCLFFIGLGLWDIESDPSIWAGIGIAGIGVAYFLLMIPMWRSIYTYLRFDKNGGNGKVPAAQTGRISVFGIWRLRSGGLLWHAIDLPLQTNAHIWAEGRQQAAAWADQMGRRCNTDLLYKKSSARDSHIRSTGALWKAVPRYWPKPAHKEKIQIGIFRCIAENRKMPPCKGRHF